MRGSRKAAAALLAFGVAFALTPAAGAQEPVKPVVSWSGMSIFDPGETFRAVVEQDTCPGGPVSFTSPGIASVKLPELIGTVGTTLGEYTATLTCKDTTEVGTLRFTIKKPYSDQFLDKAEYAPGEPIKIDVENPPRCLGSAYASSEGFVERVSLSEVGGGRKTGVATAAVTPGTYWASVSCTKGSMSNQFTIKALPTTPPPGTTAPRPGPTTPKQKPKAPIVKPKGAADTGGGGTA